MAKLIYNLVYLYNMTKKIITISVDVEALELAKLKITNVSAYLNECLVSLNGRVEVDMTEKDLEKEVQQLKDTIKEAAIKQSIALEAIKNIKTAKTIKAEEVFKNEQFKRWNCGACHHLNFMDSIRCGHCNLPTKNDSKTTIIMLNSNGDAE